MKRSFVFLGLCLMVAAGLTTFKQAKSSAKAVTATYCCDIDGNPYCGYGPGGTRTKGPRVANLSDCIDF